MKPSNFYIGMSEFLSILVPGFIVTAAISIYLKIIDYKSLEDNEWVALIIASYILGHILFALGSYWDYLYDTMKPKGNEELLEKIGQIRTEKAERDCNKINKYKWCRSVLLNIHPEGFAEVLRKESDSKLFRSLIIPLLVYSILAIMVLNVLLSLTLLVLVLISFWKYRDQRFKACKIAYTHVIVLYQLGTLDKQYV